VTGFRSNSGCVLPNVSGLSPKIHLQRMRINRRPGGAQVLNSFAKKKLPSADQYVKCKGRPAKARGPRIPARFPLLDSNGQCGSPQSAKLFEDFTPLFESHNREVRAQTAEALPRSRSPSRRSVIRKSLGVGSFIGNHRTGPIEALWCSCDLVTSSMVMATSTTFARRG